MTRALIHFDSDNRVSVDWRALIELCELDLSDESAAATAFARQGEFRHVDGVTTVTPAAALAIAERMAQERRPVTARTIADALTMAGVSIEQQSTVESSPCK